MQVPQSMGSASPLSPSAIYQLALNAGFSGTDAVTAAAIAMAESAGNPGAQGDYGNPVAGQYNAFGLWQINTGENPEFVGANLDDPQTNASAAYQLYSAAGGFSPWSTYNSGAYQPFVAQVTTAIGSAGVSVAPVLAGINFSSPAVQTGVLVAAAALGAFILADFVLD